jgi:2-methylisocitrate lyase-like PEP mutase family enzyme
MIPREHYQSPTDRRRVFRKRLEAGQTMWIPGIYDGLSAKMAEQSGAEAVVLSGFALSAALLGQPDAELYTMTEVRGALRNIFSATSVPIMVDGDNGYGNAVSVIRTIQEFEAAGATSITIEDQASPKRCPMIIDQPELISVKEAVGKIKAALDARRDEMTTIIARTDAQDHQELVDRSCAYAEAGAHVIKPIVSKTGTMELLSKIRSSCGRPLALSLSPRIEALPRDEVEKVAGIMTFPLIPVLAVTRALRDTFTALLSTRGTKTLPIQPIDTAEFKKLIGFEVIQDYESKYLPPSA